MGSSNNKKILIIEDEKSIANILQLKLKEEGFDISVANDGYEALDMMKEGGYDLYLLDIIMPEIDGFEVLEELHKRGDKTPVIVSSNLTQEKDKARAKSLGVHSYVDKSDTGIWQVIDQIKAFLNQKR